MEFLDFLEFKVTDFIDIFLVAVLLYYIYKLVRGTVAINIFIGIVIVWGFWKLTQILDMKMISSMVGGFMSVGLIALIIVFQQELRQFLLMIGTTNLDKKKFAKRFNLIKQDGFGVVTDIDAILTACDKMAKSKTGAILVFKKNNSLDTFKATGDTMNLEVNGPILESIFFKNSPLHDGAAIIERNSITATRVILPISNERNIPLRYGLRHRAAAGITEKTDALALVVSEETGQISYLKGGQFVPFKDLGALSEMLKTELD
ncbi:MAG: diadenylate cyclase [Flavobacteriaceae bacterium]|nr:diadenylate cyclase [Flavobacteriaceae bacterium]MDH3796502.1 diadenylate cyclase [Flavobacteriaceae bacterium]